MKDGNRTKRLGGLILTVLMIMAAMNGALASTGDRTLMQGNDGSGYVSNYVNNAIISGREIYLFTVGNGSGISVYNLDSGETADYDLQELQDRLSGMSGEEEEAEQRVNEDGDAYTEEIACWFLRDGSLYAVLNRAFRHGESSEMEGGYIRKLVLADGKADLAEADDMPRLAWDEMIEQSGDSAYSRWISSTASTGDWLAAVAYGDSGEMELHLFNLKTGEAETADVSAVDDVAAGPEGTLLLGRNSWGERSEVILEKYDIEEDETELLARIPMDGSNARSFAWDGETETLYFVSNGELFSAPGGDIESAQSVNDCGISGSRLFAQMTDDGFMLVYGYDGAVLRNTDPSQRSNVTIRIRPFAWVEGTNTAYYAFTGSRGDIGVIREDYGDESTLLQAMMNQDDRVDLYTLSVNSSTFNAVYERGFMGDLSGNAKLTAKVEAMYPFLQEIAMKDGKLVMIPLQMAGTVFGYDTEAWEKLGLTGDDIPKTWNEFLDLLEALPAKLEGTDFRAFELWESQQSIRSSIISRIIQTYALSKPDDYFNTPMLAGLMDRVMKLDLDALGVLEDDEMEDVYSRFEALGGDKTQVLTTSMEVCITSYGQNMQALALGFEEGDEGVLPVSLTVGFLNPYSTHQAEAMAYLETMADTITNTTLYSFRPEMDEPLRYPDHEEQRKSLSKWVETARKNIEEAEDEETAEVWEGYLKEMEETLANFDETNWMISPKAIESYRERSKYIRVETFNFWNQLSAGENGEAFSNLWDGYLEGQRNVKELLSFMDQKIRMMRMEGN